jgi:hypothetical protein
MAREEWCGELGRGTRQRPARRRCPRRRGRQGTQEVRRERPATSGWRREGARVGRGAWSLSSGDDRQLPSSTRGGAAVTARSGGGARRRERVGTARLGGGARVGRLETTRVRRPDGGARTGVKEQQSAASSLSMAVLGSTPRAATGLADGVGKGYGTERMAAAGGGRGDTAELGGAHLGAVGDGTVAFDDGASVSAGWSFMPQPLGTPARHGGRRTGTVEVARTFHWGGASLQRTSTGDRLRHPAGTCAERRMPVSCGHGGGRQRR